MKFKIDQHVTYQGRRWIVTGSGTDGEGNVTYYLKRGVYRTTAKEKELSK